MAQYDRAAFAVVEDEDVPKLDQGVAQTLINTYLKPSWEVANQQEKKKFL
ncbi:hypothetical protein [Paenibacillus thalictri]|nr:hypothetical protein [Paenibacillus thalictri]